MKFYKVKNDWFFWNKKGNGQQLIKDELFTTTEMKRKGLPFNEQYFDVVELDRNDVHMMFGARFENIK